MVEGEGVRRMVREAGGEGAMGDALLVQNNRNFIWESRGDPAETIIGVAGRGLA